MTFTQHIWLATFNFGPAIILSIYKQWWIGILALFATSVLSWIFTLIVTMNLPIQIIKVWAWVKAPVVASIVLAIGWRLF